MKTNRARATFHDLAPEAESFRDCVLEGLSRRAKSVPCRFLYDARGSDLFEEICELPEYYPTRTETAILAARAPEIAAVMGPRCELIEFGSGSSRKVRLLLDALREPAAYVAIDISGEALRQAANDLAASFPTLAVVAVCADYMRPLELPELPAAGEGSRLAFFPGSTIGNLEPALAIEFLSGCRRVIGKSGAMLVGVDLQKDPDILNAAYNDSRGVTAAFNLNLLARANRELGGDFNLDRFAHDAAYDAKAGKIEIFIRSRADQIVTVAGRRFRFAEGERIHTEDSWKYTIAGFRQLAVRAGYRPSRCWTDPAALFSVHLLTPA
ncbi:MAG TPA: L-histidine N(alpha)-methyltransferase [Stellaceae bacterium]|nr:L-histidine N(alpha)-methyltransferase [Stellaceae bacterium]